MKHMADQRSCFAQNEGSQHAAGRQALDSSAPRAFDHCLLGKLMLSLVIEDQAGKQQADL